MDATEIRFKNFSTLFRQFREENSHLPNRGMLKLFAERVELSDRYLSHVKHKRKNIGAAIARQIEKRLKLPHGWMDNPHDKIDASNEQEREFLETALALFRTAPQDAQAAMIDILRRRLTGLGK
jgi:hypothetical protein